MSGPFLPPRLNQFCNQPGPPGLVGCAHAPAIVAVKIFVKEQVVVKMRVVLDLRVLAMHRTPTVVVLLKNADQPLRKVVSNFPQGTHVSASRGVFYLKI